MKWYSSAYSMDMQLIFNVIAMKTRTGKKIYLQCNEHGGGMVWTFDKQEACMFETEEQAKEFAQKYFKTCTTWTIEEVRTGF